MAAATDDRADCARAGRRGPAGIEELYLLEGDLTVEGYTMHAGDYCRAEAGSFHGEIRTKTGCKFIAIASREDELLPTLD